MSESSHSDSYQEPQSGTDLDDDNVRLIDEAELREDDDIPIDESAEAEARERPLLPGQRRAAERYMEARDLHDEDLAMPDAVREQGRRQYDNENIAAMMQQMQLEGTSQEQLPPAAQLSDTAMTSVLSEALRRYQAQATNLRAIRPMNDDAFARVCADLERQQNNQTLRQHVIVKLLHFLKTFTEEGPIQEFRPAKYALRAQDLFGNQRKSSIVIDLIDLNTYSAPTAQFLVSAPRLALQLINEALRVFIADLEKNVTLVHALVEARIRVEPSPSLPLQVCALKALQTQQLDKLVAVRGVVVSRSEKKPRLLSATFQCKQCKCLIGPFDVRSASVVVKNYSNQNTAATVLPRQCPNEACGSTHLQLYGPASVYQDVQRLQLQERQEDTDPGYTPEKKDVLISGDMIDSIQPGDAVLVTGTYELVGKVSDTAFPFCQVVIDANHVSTEQDVSVSFTSQDQVDLDTFARILAAEDLDQLLFRSIAPSIYGHDLVKRAVTMSLIGGVSHTIAADQPKTRGDLHLLILGDPGIAKSQILRYVQKCAPKSVLTAGKGASAAGLTVAIRRNQAGEFSLQAGALVLANGGVCLIDELDKMDEQDRVALHQAMEQQEVSIAKAGIVATLPARASVIAAANPVGQQYNQAIPLNYNINIGEALLSRFDLICICKDQIDQVNDDRLARFIIGSHVENHPQVQEIRKMIQVEEDFVQARIAERDQEENSQRAQVLDDEIRGAQERIASAQEALNAGIDQQQTELEPVYIPEHYSVNQVLAQIQRSQGQLGRIVLPQSFLKRYFQYAREFDVALSQDVMEQIKQFYTTLRVRVQEINGVQVTQRAIGTLVRLSEAHARLRLSKTCLVQDVQFAIGFYSQLFVMQQKSNVMRRVQAELRRFRHAGAEDFFGVMAVLDDCFRRLAVMLANGAPVPNVITLQYLRNECAKSGIEVADGYFERQEFLDGYEAERTSSGQVFSIRRRGQ